MNEVVNPDKKKKPLFHIPVNLVSKTMRLQFVGVFQDIEAVIQLARDELLEKASALPNATGAKIGDLPLIEVTVNHCHLDDKGFTKIVDFVMENNHILSLEAIGNKLTDRCAQDICRLIRLSCLERIKIGDNQLTNVTCAKIYEAFASPDCSSGRVLQQLHMGGNRIDAEGIRDLCKTAERGSIRALSLRNMVMCEESWGCIGALVASSAPINDLHLRGNSLVEALAGSLASRFFERLAQSERNETKLRALSLANCSISGTVLHHKICPVLEKLGNLNNLDLSNNPLREGTEDIALWLKNASSLSCLVMHNTEMSLNSLRLMAGKDDGVPMNKLTNLDISHNSFPPEADHAFIVARTIRNSPTLKRVKLSWMQMCGIGLKALAESICSHPSMLNLDMSGNFLGEAPIEAKEAWLRLITETKTLRRIALTDNALSIEMVAKVCIALHSSLYCSIVALSIGGQSREPPVGNELNATVQRFLNDILLRNREVVGIAAAEYAAGREDDEEYEVFPWQFDGTEKRKEIPPMTLSQLVSNSDASIAQATEQPESAKVLQMRHVIPEQAWQPPTFQTMLPQAPPLPFGAPPPPMTTLPVGTPVLLAPPSSIVQFQQQPPLPPPPPPPPQQYDFNQMSYPVFMTSAPAPVQAFQGQEMASPFPQTGTAAPPAQLLVGAMPPIQQQQQQQYAPQYPQQIVVVVPDGIQ